MTPTTPSAPDRRTVLRGAAVAGAVGAVAVPLAACTTENAGAKAAGPRAGDQGPVTIGKVPDISVGAGEVFAESRVVVTRPEPNVYKAFDARCPHRGCLVDEVEQGVVKCNCHGSQFDVNDGSKVRGPATTGLPEIPLRIVDGDIVVG